MRFYEIVFLSNGLCTVQAHYGGAHYEEPEIMGVYYSVSDALREFPWAMGY